jgi:hypothetical protein
MITASGKLQKSVNVQVEIVEVAVFLYTLGS